MEKTEKIWKSAEELERRGELQLAIGLLAAHCGELRQRKVRGERSLLLLLTIFRLVQLEVWDGDDGLGRGIKRLEQELLLGGRGLQGGLGLVLGELYERKLEAELLKPLPEQWAIEGMAQAAYKAYCEAAMDRDTRRVMARDVEHIWSGLLSKELNGLTLYEVIIERALQFFLSPHGRWGLGLEGQIEEAEALSAADIFMGWRFLIYGETTVYRVLLLWQQLMEFHKKGGDAYALGHADMRRLAFVWAHSSLENRDILYAKELEAIRLGHEKRKLGAEAAYQLGEFYITSWRAGLAEGRHLADYLERGLALLSWAEVSFPHLLAGQEAATLRAVVLERRCTIQIEQALPMGGTTLVSVCYQNISGLYYRVLAVTRTLKRNLDFREGAELFRYLKKLKPRREGRWELPAWSDCQAHRAEVELGAMPKGDYVLLVSHDKDFSQRAGNVMSFAFYEVSGLVHFCRHISGWPSFFVLDRQTGAPVEAVRMRFGMQAMNTKTNALLWEAARVQFTDENGYASLPKPTKPTNTYIGGFKATFAKDGDRIIIENGFFDRLPLPSPPARSYKTELLLVNLVYQPQDLLEFKGIMIRLDEEHQRQELAKNKEVKVILLDVNGQKVDEINLRTNDFGTYVGAFRLPDTTLLGKWSIMEEASQTVREFYMRIDHHLKLEITTTLPQSPLNVGDLVPITVHLSGANPTEWTVIKFTVTRQVSYPHWDWRWGELPPTNPAQQIHKQALNISAPDFTLSILAQPDHSVSASHLPLYTYIVSLHAYLSDGRICDHRICLNICPANTRIEAFIPEFVNARDEFYNINIRPKNLNNNLVATDLSLSIWRLAQPLKPIPPRILAKPDDPAYPQNGLDALFPIPNRKDQPPNWPLAEVIYQNNFPQAADLQLPISQILAGQPQGAYAISIQYKDQNNRQLTFERLFTYYDSLSDSSPPNYFSCLPEKSAYAFGDTAHIILASTFPNTHIHLQIEINNRTIHNQYHEPKSLLRIPCLIQQSAANHFLVTATAFINNKFIVKEIVVPIMLSSAPQPQIKIHPPAHSKCHIQVRDPLGQPISAELLIALYIHQPERDLPVLRIPTCDPAHLRNYAKNIYNPTAIAQDWSLPIHSDIPYLPPANFRLKTPRHVATKARSSNMKISSTPHTIAPFILHQPDYPPQTMPHPLFLIPKIQTDANGSVYIDLPKTKHHTRLVVMANTAESAFFSELFLVLPPQLND